MTGAMSYDRSNMPAGRGKPQPQLEPQYDPTQGAISGPDRDSLTYPSLAAEGRWELVLPLSNADNSVVKVEKVQIRHLGIHVSKRVERAFEVSSANAGGTLAWYAQHMKSLELFDARTLGEMEKLVKGFSPSRRPEQYFIDNVQPFLTGLMPKRR